MTTAYKEPISGASKAEGEITVAKRLYPVANLRNAVVTETIAMLENSAWCARGAEARLFGWHQRSDPRLLQRNDPFGVNHWVGGAVGVVRDQSGGVPKWDELLKCKCDIDATLPPGTHEQSARLERSAVLFRPGARQEPRRQ